MRAVMALARLEASQGNRQKALDAIAVAERLISNYAPLKALRQSIENGEKPEQQVTDATQGAASVLFSVGSALNRQGAEEMVSLYLQISHALDAKSADTIILLGGIAEKLEQPKQAIELYGRVPEGSPMRRISELQLGLTLAQTGDVTGAREHLKALLESDPTDIRSYIAYGSVLSDAKDYAEMAKVYDKAVDVIGPAPRPTDWSVFFQRGIAYERLKEWDKSEPNFKKALELNPDQPQVLNYLGYSWVDMNRNLKEGMDLIRKAVELRPDDGYIVDSLGWAYYRLGQYEEAVTELERAVQLRAGDAAINDHLGDAYWRVGRKLEAGYQWQRALTMKPELTEIPKIEKKISEGLGPAEAPPEQAAVVSPAVTAPTLSDAAQAPAAAPDTGKPANYIVNRGDTLRKIATDVLGDGDRIQDLINANPELKRNPNRLYPGQVLELPGPRN
jgi:tetratricopeptide (TPR) repeat protein